MEAYTDFAAVYDTFMDETPYDVWGDFVKEIIDKYGISKPYETPNEKKNISDEGEEEVDLSAHDMEEALAEERNLVVDLGCGTGNLTVRLAGMGYDVLGIDLSAEMLNIARQKSQDAGLNIMYLEQDMRELDLYCTAGTIVSVCDSINYLLEDEDVIETFRLVNNFLYPGGIFVFDFNTLHKYRDVIGDATIAENREDCSFIWENYYHEEEHINEYDLTIFSKCGDGRDLFKKSTENHYQRGYTLEEMTEFVKSAGLEFVEAVDADTHEAPTDESERIYIIARESGKQSL